MVNSSLITADALVRGDLNMAVKVSADQDRCIFWNEFDGLGCSWTSDEFQHELGWGYFVVLNDRADIWRFDANTHRFFVRLILLKIIKDQSNDNLRFTNTNHSSRLQHRRFFNSNKRPRPITHILYQKLVLSRIKPYSKMTPSNSFIILKYNVIFLPPILQMAPRWLSASIIRLDQRRIRPICHLLFEIVPSTKESAEFFELIVLLLN